MVTLCGWMLFCKKLRLTQSVMYMTDLAVVVFIMHGNILFTEKRSTLHANQGKLHSNY